MTRDDRLYHLLYEAGDKLIRVHTYHGPSNGGSTRMVVAVARRHLLDTLKQLDALAAEAVPDGSSPDGRDG